MTKQTHLYLNDGTDLREMERAVRLCLHAEWQLPPTPTLEPNWEAWSSGSQWRKVAAHVVNVYRLSQKQALKEIIAADSALADALVAHFPPDAILPSAPDPLRKALMRSVTTGKTPGHVGTLIAVGACSFHLPLLVALQTAFFVEWHVRQTTRKSASVTLFTQTCQLFLAQLPPFLQQHPSHELNRFATR